MAEAPPLRAGVVGVSESATCGVRDHATLLAAALAEEGVTCSPHWLERRGGGYRASARRFREWTGALGGELEAAGAEAVILHYSVFSYSFRGVPVFVRPVTRALRATGLPVVGFMHELAYPWRIGGARGKAWAATQRAVLPGLIGACASVVVTAPFRAEWLRSRPYLPRRPVELAPVFSNLPASSAVPAAGEAPTIGLFGYAYEGAAPALALDALAAVRAGGVGARLVLLGAPGPDSPAGSSWAAAARARGLEQAVSFSGRLEPQRLADALASCHVLLHAEPSGPTSRKGTLAASLASARPVVAIDGPLRWRELVDSGAIAVCAPSPAALAGELARLLGDPAAADALGARGGEFARSRMSVAGSAAIVASALRRATGSRELARPGEAV